MTDAIWDLTSSFLGSGSTDLTIGPADVAGTPPNWSVTRTVLSSGLSAGVEMIVVDNGRMKISVIATRGMGVWAAEIDGQRLGWNSPVRGPVHPRFVSLMEPSGAGWLDGFDELVARCGLESNGSAVFDGEGRLKFPLHGRIANRPAHTLRVEIDTAVGAITLSGIVDESRFHFQKLRLITSLTTSFGGTSFGWHDQVVNVGGAPATMQMLYHINVGEPLLAPGARLWAPAKSVSPHDYYQGDAALRSHHVYPNVGPIASQQSFFFDLLADEKGSTQVLLEHPSEDRGLTIRFNKRELPWFTQWRNNATADDGYVTGLEPGTNFPNPRPFEDQNGRVVMLGPGEAWAGRVELDWHLDRDHVSQAKAEVQELQGGLVPEVHEAPRPGWSAKA